MNHTGDDAMLFLVLVLLNAFAGQGTAIERVLRHSACAAAIILTIALCTNAFTWLTPYTDVIALGA